MPAARLAWRRIASQLVLSTEPNLRQINAGCSGWFYWHWRGGFYPSDFGRVNRPFLNSHLLCNSPPAAPVLPTLKPVANRLHLGCKIRANLLLWTLDMLKKLKYFANVQSQCFATISQLCGGLGRSSGLARSSSSPAPEPSSVSGYSMRSNDMPKTRPFHEQKRTKIRLSNYARAWMKPRIRRVAIGCILRQSVLGATLVRERVS